MNVAILSRTSAPAVPSYTLEERADIRGSMWTARGPLSWGPRPHQPSNILCIDYFECFSPSEQDQILALYGPKSHRRYGSAPMGPMIDPGYHGQLPSVDWRSNPRVYLDAAAKLERAGIKVIHFLRPDRGVMGLEWTPVDLDRELGPIFRSAEAQTIMHTVCLGWEPGPKYFYNNAWWVEMCQWMARTFPDALRLIHMVADCDAPVGQDDDVKGISNGQGWANVAPYIHGFLAQYGGYVEIDQRHPEFAAKYAAFKSEFAKAIRRNTDGFTKGVGGWPTGSAWGTKKGILAYAGEYAAFAAYWQNAPEEHSIELGDLAVASGAAGFLDGGTVR